MTEGIHSELNELLALKRYAQSVAYKPEARALQNGNHLSRLRGRGMDFAEVRNYQAGDEIRHMEWRVTARTGRAHVKLFQEERERPVVILGDLSSSMFFGTKIAFKSVVAAQLAALIAWTAVKQGDKAGALFFSNKEHLEFMPRRRESGILPMLSALSELTMQPVSEYKIEPEKLNNALLRLRRVAKPGSILVLISDFYGLNEEGERHLHRLKRHNDILAYHVCDFIERVPPKPQKYAITNGHKEIVLDTSIPSIRQGYLDFCQQRITQLQEIFKRTQIHYVQATAADDLPQLVRQTYPGRSRG